MPIVIAAIIGLMLGVYIGLLTGAGDRMTYKKCRYYDQTIERCVAELGWEKK